MKSVTFSVNGEIKRFIVDQDYRLLDLLRKDLRLTGAKQSCDRKGQCGACTVIVNGKAVRSCLTRVASLEGAELLTIEGLGTPENPHLIQEAFSLAGAIQCGYCTPGMIMAAKALLDQNPSPSVLEIKHALRRNLCRCTGYQKIVDAVILAGRFLRGETTPEAIRPKKEEGWIGPSIPRPSAMLKACGRAEFTADIRLTGALELAVVRSPHPNARVVRIDTTRAQTLPGVAGVMTAADIRGSNRITVLVDDMPLLCETHCPVLGAPVAVVAAQTRQQALNALEAVEVEYEILPAMRTPAEAMMEGASQVHEGRPNICFSHPQIRGDAETALARSAAVAEAVFSTPMVHQAPIEPEAGLAYLEGEGEDAKLVVIGRGINIHHHIKVLQDAIGWKNIRYEEAYSGGQFGIKLDITAEGIAAAAALHFKRPVRYICSLTESMQTTTKRHPYEVRTRLGADASGRLTGLDMDFTVENGAYTSFGNIIILKSLQMLSNSYYIPHVRAMGRLVYTNNAWGGAARGAGVPQTNYALESAMDLLARKLGIDPLEFRLMNSLQPGQPMSTGQVVEEWPFPGCLETLRPRYERALSDAAAFRDDRLKRGVGIAGGSFGLGKSGPGDTSTVVVELNPDDGLTIYASVADPGEGNDSMLTQIAGHLTGVPMEKIRLVTRDTDQTPDSGAASGSRQTYMSGNALVNGLEKLKAAMENSGSRTCRELVDAGQPTRYTGVKVQDTEMLDPVNGQGIPYESRVHGVQMAEVAVDTQTGEIRLLKMTAVVDAGIVINRNNVEGQMQGGMDMGAGLALREEYVHGVTTDWITFPFPTMKTAFDMEIILRETPRKKGPLGAVGVGEFVLLPTPAAIMNALEHATGARITRLPATPERVLQALRGTT